MLLFEPQGRRNGVAFFADSVPKDCQLTTFGRLSYLRPINI